MRRYQNGAYASVPRRQLSKRINVDPLPVHRHADDPRPGGAKRSPGERVAGVLDGDSLAGRCDGTSSQEQRHLAASGEEDIVRPHGQGASVREPLRKRNAKAQAAARISITVGAEEGARSKRPPKRARQLGAWDKPWVWRSVGEDEVGRGFHGCRPMRGDRGSVSRLILGRCAARIGSRQVEGHYSAA